MMLTYLSFLMLFFYSPALAGDFGFGAVSPPTRPLMTQPLFPDITPGDGVFDAGSLANPYTLQGPDGHTYITEPLIHDDVPNDGVFDAGSFSNPWLIEPLE